MLRFVLPKRRTRVWLGIETLIDGSPHPHRIEATLMAALTAIEERGGLVRSVEALPVPFPGETVVLLVIVYRETFRPSNHP